MKHPMLVALATLLGIHAALAGDKPKTLTEPIPKAYAHETAVSLKCESRSTKGKFQTVDVRLINPTDAAVVFTGYSEQSPWYKIQKWVDGEWSDHRVGWFCGTGLRLCTIYPGQSAVIPVHVKEDLFPIRVGVEYSKGTKKDKQVAWSARIDRESSNKPSGGDGK